MKHGLRAIFRTKIRSFLFFVLILAITLFLSLGTSIWATAQNMLSQADQLFLTAGEIVFQQGNYPKTTEYDSQLQEINGRFSIEELEGLPGVLLAEPSYAMRGTIEDYEVAASLMPFSGYALVYIEAGDTELVEDYEYILDEDGYAVDYNIVKVDSVYRWGTVNDVLAGTQNKTGLVLLYPPEDESYTFENHHSYVVFGRFETSLYSGYRSFIPESPAGLIGMSGGPDMEDTPYIFDVTEIGLDGFLAVEETAVYDSIGEMLDVENNAVNLIATHNLGAVDAFHRGEYTITEGAFFSEEHYAAGNGAILPYRFAKLLGYGVGETFTLKLHGPGSAEHFSASYWPQNGFAAELEVEVVGLYNASGISTPVYITANGQEWLSHTPGDYTLGRVVIENRKAASFEAAVEGRLPTGLSLKLYDQGYETATKSVFGMLETANLITVISLLVCAVVLFFFGYLYIYRNAESARILLSLGAGNHKTRSYLLSGAFFVSLLAAAVGSVAGYFASGQITKWVFEYVEQSSEFDLRFSMNGFGVRLNEYAAQPETLPFVFVLVGLFVVLFALLVCFIIAQVTIARQDPHRRFARQYKKELHKQKSKRTSPKRAVGSGITARLPGTSLRYAVRSILRGGQRGFVVILSFSVVLMFLYVLGGMRDGYQARLDTVYEDIPVTLQFTDVRGRVLDEMHVSEKDYKLLADNEDFVQDAYYTRHAYYSVAAIADPGERAAQDAIGEENFAASLEALQEMRELYGRTFVLYYPDIWFITIPPGADILEIPREDYSYQAFIRQIKTKFEPIVIASNFNYAPEFIYSGPPEVAWAEGFDEETFNTSTSWVDVTGFYNETAILVPRSFLQRYDCALGDTVYLNFIVTYSGYSDTYYDVVNPALRIAGTFDGQTVSDTVYLPTSYDILAGYFSYDWTSGNYYDSVGAVLKNTENLGEFKDWLAEHFSEVNTFTGVRTWVVVDDTNLYNTIEELERYITYINILYPPLLVLTVVIGFVTATLLLRSRHREIALLRSVGERRLGVFLSFFLEQLLLAIPGIAIGTLVAWLLTGGFVWSSLWIAAVYAGCYLVGCAIAILQAQRITVMKNLTEREE